MYMAQVFKTFISRLVTLTLVENENLQFLFFRLPLAKRLLSIREKRFNLCLCFEAHTGFPLKIGEFPTHFDTFSIDSVFFNLQVVTSSNWNCHVQLKLALVKLDLTFVMCDLSLFQLKLSIQFIRTNITKQKQDLPLLLEHKNKELISQYSFHQFFSVFW